VGSIPVLKPREVVVLLERLGFVGVRQRGSHRQFRHADGAAAGQAPVIDIVLAQYIGAFESEQRRVTYLAPLEHVYFAKTQLDFGSFTIRRFSLEELATLLETGINRVFYEWALTEVRPLDDHWYISLTKSLKRRQPGETRINLSDIEKVLPTLNRAIELTALRAAAHSQR
jgi:hypothetical protein